MGRNIRKNLDLYNLIAHKPSFNSVITYFILLVKKTKFYRNAKVSNSNKQQQQKTNAQEMKMRK